MADDNKAADETTEAQSDEKSGKGKGLFANKKLLIMAAGGLLLLLGGGGGAAYYLGFLGGGSGPEQAIARPAAYYDLPEMVVNLAGEKSRSQYLKIKVALEAADAEVFSDLETVMPRILDLFQVYLRELRKSDLEGSAGVFRLKEELLRRINLSIHPRRVDRVLFKEIIVQ